MSDVVFSGFKNPSPGSCAEIRNGWTLLLMDDDRAIRMAMEMEHGSMVRQMPDAAKVLLLTSPLYMQGTALNPVGLQGVCRASSSRVFRSGKGGSDTT